MNLREELRRAELEYLEERKQAKNRLALAYVENVEGDDISAEQKRESNAFDNDLEEARRKALESARKLDADDSASEASDSDEESDDDDDDDDTAELMRELEKIKRERAEQKEKAEQEKEAQEAALREEEILTGNPLLHQDFTVKRRYNYN